MALQTGGGGCVKRPGSASFQRPEWVQTYLRVFEPDNRLVLLTVYSAKELISVLPLVRKRSSYACIPVVKLREQPMLIQFDLKSYERKALLVKLLWRRCGNFCSPCQDGTFLSCRYFPNTEPASNSWRSQALTVLIPSPFWRRTARRCKCSAMPMVCWLGWAQGAAILAMNCARKERLLEEQAGDKLKLVCHTEPHAETLHEFSGWKRQAGKARKGLQSTVIRRRGHFTIQLRAKPPAAGIFGCTPWRSTAE